MSTRRRNAKATGSKGEGDSEKLAAVQEEPHPDTVHADPELGARTSVTKEERTVPAEERSVTGALNPVEKENTVNTTDTKPREGTAAHAQTHAPAGRAVPLGKPKSGRVWKDRNKQRFSALLRDKPLRTSWQKKMEAKREKKLVRSYHQQLKDQQAKEKEDKRKRRQENLRRREENERKAEIVQVIRNTAKLKRMKKKQLRKIEKRDTLAVLQKTPFTVKKAGKGE